MTARRDRRYYVSAVMGDCRAPGRLRWSLFVNVAGGSGGHRLVVAESRLESSAHVVPALELLERAVEPLGFERVGPWETTAGGFVAWLRPRNGWRGRAWARARLSSVQARRFAWRGLRKCGGM